MLIIRIISTGLCLPYVRKMKNAKTQFWRRGKMEKKKNRRQKRAVVGWGAIFQATDHYIYDI